VHWWVLVHFDLRGLRSRHAPRSLVMFRHIVQEILNIVLFFQINEKNQFFWIFWKSGVKLGIFLILRCNLNGFWGFYHGTIVGTSSPKAFLITIEKLEQVGFNGGNFIILDLNFQKYWRKISLKIIFIYVFTIALYP
jgi:hypothetical protein